MACQFSRCSLVALFYFCIYVCALSMQPVSLLVCCALGTCPGTMMDCIFESPVIATYTFSYLVVGRTTPGWRPNAGCQPCSLSPHSLAPRHDAFMVFACITLRQAYVAWKCIMLSPSGMELRSYASKATCQLL